MQDEKECFMTGCQSGLDKHHIYHGTANRALSEQYGCWCWLKHELHMKLHDSDKKLDRYLEQECQRKFEDIHGGKVIGRKKFMEVFGKNYLGD
jgi:hypothetical protein